MRKNNRKSEDYTGEPSKYPQKYFKDKPCKWCSVLFSPLSPCHMYCGDECKDKAYADSYYKRYYGISLNKFYEMLDAQGGKCCICKGVGFKMNKHIKELLVVDHCHTTNKVRGLLCNNCNRGLGLFKDSVNSLEAAIEYLKS